MAGTVEQKLAAQGIVLTEPRTPMANYVGFVRQAICCSSPARCAPMRKAS